MQFLGVFAFICALMAMFLNYIERRPYTLVAYASAVLLLTASLVISLVEIWQSTRALEIAMRDMKGKK
jgi:membrane-associated PAP2 superfamily phosphatase